jgi:DNA primase
MREVAFAEGNFDHLSPKSFPKTSGSRLIVVRSILRLLRGSKPSDARATHQQRPELAVSKMEKRLGPGKFSWIEPERGTRRPFAFIPCALRAPTVSTPLTWEELKVAENRRAAD